MIFPPFMTGGKPSITLSTLKAILKKNDINSEILYANLLLKRKIDPYLYEEFSYLFNHHNIVEFIFSLYAFPSLTNKHNEYISLLKKRDINLFNKIISIQEVLDDYLADVRDIIIEKSPRIVWLHSFINQVTASIAIANVIKNDCKDCIITIGGHSSLSPMGDELLKIAPSIDYVFSGEPEEEYPKFCISKLMNTKNIREAGLKDKDKEKYPKIIQCPPVSDINKFPFPDFSDYKDQTSKLWFFNNAIDFEGSRGCWHGVQSHCLFCGQNNQYIKYRKKQPDRALKELEYLIKTYDPEYIYTNDSIMPMDYPQKLFNQFKKPKKLKNIFYEVSPQLSFKDLSILKNNGMNSCQPGIESFNDSLLDMLKKKTNTSNNIRFLRDCRTLQIEPFWNLLYGIPGEDEINYFEMLKIIPYLYHLKPPVNIRKLVIQRFSPMYEQSERYNIKNLEPLETYNYIFPDNANLEKLSLYFTGTYKTAFENDILKKDFFSCINKWQSSWKHSCKPKLEIALKNNTYIIIDSRGEDQKESIVTADHYRLLNYLPVPINEKKIESFVQLNNIKKEFIELLKNNYILKVKNNYISLVVDKTISSV